MYNYSCDPNSENKFISKEVVIELRAIKPIAIGEEITLTYCDTFDDRATRQAELLQKYKFTGHCRVCNIPRTAVPESNRRRDQINYVLHRPLCSVPFLALTHQTTYMYLELGRAVHVLPTCISVMECFRRGR